MINNERIKYWTNIHFEHRPRISTLAHPFEDHVDVFKDKNILEIGPGEGRQFKKIQPLSKTYAIADISQKLLEDDLYKNVDQYLIKDYNEDFDRKFNIITFWYVLHHVLEEELQDFINFLKRHLVTTGFLYFNSPNNIIDPDAIGSNGILVTNYSSINVKNILMESGFTITLEDDKASNCFCIMAQYYG